MSTTYRFVPMSEVKPEQITALIEIRNYMIRLSEVDGEEIILSGRKIKYHFPSAKLNEAWHSIQLPVEPFCPLSEEEIEELGYDKYPILPTATMIDANEIRRSKFIEGLEKGISLMEGDKEATIEWLEENGWFSSGMNELTRKWYKREWRGDKIFEQEKTTSELLAIFREEQKKEKP